MHAFTYVWSVLVTWQRWWSHHSIRHSQKPYAACKLCLTEPELLLTEVLYCGNMDFFTSFAPVTLTLTWWPSYTNLTRVPSRYTGGAKMNFLCQGFQKLSYYRHTYHRMYVLSDCVSTVSAASGRYRLRSTGSAAYVLQEQEQNSVNVASSTPFQPPGTLFHQTFMTLLIRVHSGNDSRMYFLIVLNNWLLLALLDESYSGALQISRWLTDWYRRQICIHMPSKLYTTLLHGWSIMTDRKKQTEQEATI